LLQVKIPPVGQVPVNVACSVPQTLVLLEAIVGVPGAGVVVITTGIEGSELPHSFLQTAVYVPAPTTLGFVVLPSDHTAVPLVQLAVNVVVSVPQSINLPATTVGATGATPVPITTGVEVSDVPQVLIHVAVYVPAPTMIGLPV
jgi:hypothetical protein